MPQLDPEFFVSQLFWLILTFSFLLIFLWRISLPRISSVLEKRENKINHDFAAAKKLQAEAEEIQKQINKQLHETRTETADLIKKAIYNFKDHEINELRQLDKNIGIKIDKSAEQIEKNKIKSVKQIHDQIYDITKLTLSKISNVSVADKEIQQTVDQIENKVLN